MTIGSKRGSERKQVAKRESFKICIPPRVISADLITVTVFCSTDSRCLSVRHRSVVERTSLPGSMTKERRTSSPVDQGSHLHMAIKLLKAENANLEKIIILLRTENQNMQRKMKEMEYQNDRFKITQNQLKEELKREKELVRYLHNVNKKYERTLQKKEAESRQLRKEAKEAELRSLKRESKDINNNAKDERSGDHNLLKDLTLSNETRTLRLSKTREQRPLAVVVVLAVTVALAVVVAKTLI